MLSLANYVSYSTFYMIFYNIHYLIFGSAEAVKAAH